MIPVPATKDFTGLYHLISLVITLTYIIIRMSFGKKSIPIDIFAVIGLYTVLVVYIVPNLFFSSVSDDGLAERVCLQDPYSERCLA
jgi:hypothetical protein